MVFHPNEAQKIKGIPLPIYPQLDALYWPIFTEGLYSVKSGSKALCVETNQDSASSSVSVPSKKFWSNQWKLKVPGKVKSLLWRACTDSLPTKSNLCKRKILGDPTCSLCLKEPETILHALWGCEKIQVVWPRGFAGLQRSPCQLQYYYWRLGRLEELYYSFLNLAFVVPALKVIRRSQ